MMVRNLLLVLLIGVCSISVAVGFAPPLLASRTLPLVARSTATANANVNVNDRHVALKAVSDDLVGNEEETPDGIWLPQLRQVMGSIASLGVLETAYLTYNKLSGQVSTLCGTGGSCNDVLNGPYSNVPFTEIPLAVMGLLAYLTVTGLALAPLLDPESDDSGNRVALTAMSTAMGTFSIVLMTILFGVLQTSCPYCVFSATCSILLATMAWIGGCLPESSKTGGKLAGTTFLVSTMAAVLLFVSVDESMADSTMGLNSALLASTSADTTTQVYTAPAVTSQSSQRAMNLATTLQSMDAKMFGAYWCSHCLDQKEVFGKQAFAKIQYMECSKEAVNSQSKACKARELPGYPTWEINGKLYPGQQELDELEDLVKDIVAGKR